MGETEVCANHVAGAKYEDLPANVVDHTERAIIDTIACGLGSRRTRDVDLLIEIMTTLGGRPEATVIGDKNRVSFMQAAQVNRVMTNILDYDDDLIKVTVLIPVALAVGELVNSSGKEIINALAHAYEMVVRIKDAVYPSEEVFWRTFERIDSGIHFGVTVVAGKFLQLSGAQMAHALGLTGRVRACRVTRPDFAKRGMPPWIKITGGDIIIPGIHAALLAQGDFPGDRTILDEGRGYEASVGSDLYDAKKLILNLGNEYRMLRNGFKFYSSCRWTSSTLDAVAAIMSENNLETEDLEEVIVKVQKLVADNFATYGPGYMIQAQFSIPYVVTMVIMGEPTGTNWYKEEMPKNLKVRELQHKMRLEEDPVVTKKIYSEQKAISTVDITAKNGIRFSKHIEYPKGEPENPFTLQDHINKLTIMASCLGMKRSQIDELIQTLSNVEKLISSCFN
jgi:2-methylcitrate dehydratase PrpD